MERRVLISGASIAGPALAFWLQRAGWSVVVVERADEFRTGGQNVDVRGAGREVLRRMGLDDEVLARGTGEQGTRFVADDGSTVAEFPAATDTTSGATAEAEILRGELSTLIVEAAGGASTGNVVEYRFGDRITAIDDGPERARVSFGHADDEDFDVVVVAEGLRSSTRRLVFGAEVKLKPLGLVTTFGSIPRTVNDDDWWNWCNFVGGRSVSLRPDRHGSTRVFLAAQVDRRPYPNLPRDQSTMAMLRERFGDAGWETPRVLDALEHSDDLYTVELAQVGAPRWSSGRVVLLGDAGYCPSPVSGMGTTLSLVGAYVLGAALTRDDDHRRAFAEYERILRPYVERAQHLPPGTPQAANPITRRGIATLHTVLRIGASPFGRGIRNLFQRPPADDFTLPPMPEPAAPSVRLPER
jgi:2-polyprenyl-6-methoxyphenol hydroxylase-like FAD-dependent oxidoreductase